MFIAMNRFRIALGAEDTFEKLWRERDSYLDGVPGFREFHLLRGPSDEEATLYASHSVWESRSAFEAWTESESFRKAHQQARAPQGTYLGHPRFEGFEVVRPQAARSEAPLSEDRTREAQGVGSPPMRSPSNTA